MFLFFPERMTCINHSWSQFRRKKKSTLWHRGLFAVRLPLSLGLVFIYQFWKLYAEGLLDYLDKTQEYFRGQRVKSLMKGSKQAACLILDPWPLLGNNASISILAHVPAQNNHIFRCLEKFHKAVRKKLFNKQALFSSNALLRFIFKPFNKNNTKTNTVLWFWQAGS